MKIHRSLLLVAAVSSLAFSGALRAEPSWETDYKKAQEQAKSDKKLLLVDFTGSDWCGWCIKLNREVFSKPEFKDYATKNLVLLEVDFPRAKAQPDAVRKQNQELAHEYQVQGFPTLVVLDSDGKKLAELGYADAIPAGSRQETADPATFVALLEKLKKG